jgi:hypothetical protein
MKITLTEEFFSCTYFKSRTSDDTIVIKNFNTSNYVKEFTDINLLIKFIDIYDYATIMVNPILKYAKSINLTSEDMELNKSNNITIYHYKKNDVEKIYFINNEYWRYDEFVSGLDEYYTKL